MIAAIKQERKIYMSIPRTNGDNNLNIKIIPTESNISGETNNAETPSIQDTPDVTANIQEQENTTEAAVDTQKNPEQTEVSDEYNISKFQKDYRDTVYYNIIPSIAKYENERKKRLLCAYIGVFILIPLAVFCFFKIEGRAGGDLACLCVCGAFGFWKIIKKQFEGKIKNVIMPVIMNSIPGFTWQNTPAVTKENISACMIFPGDNATSKSFDDAFQGHYRGVEILMTECEYKIESRNSSQTIFRGVVIRLEMNKNFEGITIVRPTSVCHDYSDLKKAKFEEIKLEDPEFMNRFKIYSTDQIESRYLLTTAFMERLKNLETAFSSSGTFCAFFDKYIYLAPYSKDDLFNLCSLVKPVTNTQQFETLFEEFVSILKFVDHFKLDKKLGL